VKRPVDSLTAEDFGKFPVWQFVAADTPDETYVKPVRQLPTKQLDGCIVGCQLRLANGTKLPGFLGNLDVTNSRLTQHFLTLSAFGPSGTVFHLARYHDIDSIKHGPAAFAAFLGLPLQAVFPITYDVSDNVVGPANLIRGLITPEPQERLSRAEIIALAVP